MKLLSIEKKYEGEYLTYYVATYLNKNGHKKDYELISRNKNLTMENFGIDKPAGVGIVAFSNDKQQILLQKEFRLSCNAWVLTFPAGLIDKGETPKEAAIREVKEETRVNVIAVDDVLSPCFTSQGFSDEKMTIVVCRCEGEPKPCEFEDEEIYPKWYSKLEAKELLETGFPMSVRTQMFLYQWIHEK